jgi:hypothetical protein
MMSEFILIRMDCQIRERFVVVPLETHLGRKGIPGVPERDRAV